MSISNLRLSCFLPYVLSILILCNGVMKEKDAARITVLVISIAVIEMHCPSEL